MAIAQIVITFEFNEDSVWLGDEVPDRDYFELVRRARRVASKAVNALNNDEHIHAHVLNSTVTQISFSRTLDECWACGEQFKPGDYAFTVDLVMNMDNGAQVPVPTAGSPVDGSTYHQFCIRCALSEKLVDEESLKSCNPEVPIPGDIEPSNEELEEIEATDNREDLDDCL
jgi:hypothetical protein